MTVCTRLRNGLPCGHKVPHGKDFPCHELHDDDRRPLFEERELTDDEKIVQDMLPCIGVGMKCHAMGPKGGMLPGYSQSEGTFIPHGSSMTWADRDGRSLGDLRKLNQSETDSLIVMELRARCLPSELEDLKRLWPTLIEVVHYLENKNAPWWFEEQRGGIHSDPLIRVLAFRTWGRRDIQWTPPPVVANAPKSKIKA